MSPELLDNALFYALALVALVSALYMVLQRNPTYSAFSFIVTLCSLSAIYGLLGSSFIAVLQIVVYAGAIMVLFLFVLMLLNVRTEASGESSGRLVGLATVISLLFFFETASVFLRTDWSGTAGSFDGSAITVARALFSPRFLYVFEATSVLILAALVGAIFLASENKKVKEKK